MERDWGLGLLLLNLTTNDTREIPTNILHDVTFLFMDKKVTKKTIWPQFRITACK